MSPQGLKLQAQLQDTKLTEEPALKVGFTVGSVAGLLSLITYFYPHIPDSVMQGILVASAFLLPIINAVFTRPRVWSPDSVQMVVDEAIKKALAEAEEQRNKAKLRLRSAEPPANGSTDFDDKSL